jgi:rod shape-determining protein MreB
VRPVPLGPLDRILGYDLAIDPGSESVRAFAPACPKGRAPRGPAADGPRLSPPLGQLGPAGPELSPQVRSDEVLVVPSLVARPEPGRAGFFPGEPVGEAALALARRHTREEPRPDGAGAASGVRIVRPIARGAVAEPAAAERLFAHVFGEAHGRAWGTRPRVLCGVGAGMTEVEQHALADALDRAGARSVRFAPALVACVLALEVQTSPGSAEVVHEMRAQFVVELGAERTGMGLASRSGVIASVSVPLGSRDLDRALAGRLRRAGLSTSSAAAARFRIELGLPAPGGEDGADRNPGASPDTERLSDPEDVLPRHVGAALAPFVAFLADEMRAVLARAPGGAVEDLVEGGIVLAGGPAATPGLAASLAADLELPVHVAPDPANLRVGGLACLLADEELLGELAVEV